jgi:hypothetical protein
MRDSKRYTETNSTTQKKYENKPLGKYVRTNIPLTGPAYHGTTNQWTQPTLRTGTTPTHITKQVTSRSLADKNTKHARVSLVFFKSNVSVFISWKLWTSGNYSKELLYCRWHTIAATYCVTIQTQRTQISGKDSNGTKHSGGSPEDGREERPKHVGVLYLQTRF